MTSCRLCRHMHADCRSEAGHLAYDAATGATVLEPHAAPSIHLQGVGEYPAKPAGELRPGDVTVWNYGYRYAVVAIAPTGSASVTVTSRDERTGQEYTRRHGRARLVAVAEPAR